MTLVSRRRLLTSPPLFLLLIRRPPRPPLFPYTTLFRSRDLFGIRERHVLAQRIDEEVERVHGPDVDRHLDQDVEHGHRSEEHTSELQSRQYLVCRLLLEKKKHCRSSSERHSSRKRCWTA